MRDDVVALYVDPRGPYPKLVREWYDEKRDARTYAGPWPVVAHPPCSRWCALAGLVQARYPQHRKGEDGGLFAFALDAVRRWGGVLEHPAYSAAWKAFGLNAPPTGGGWVNADMLGGWTCYVEQHHFGHPARKATWLYAHGVDLPKPDYRRTTGATAAVTWCMNRDWRGKDLPRIGKGVAARTPIAFAEWLLELAATARPNLTARASDR